MFRQELPGSLLDLIRAHDEALYLLHSQGVTVGGRVHGDPLEFEMYTSEKIRRDALRNWWRWAFPFARALAPSSKPPLAQQARLDRRVARYREAIENEPRDLKELDGG